MQDLVGKIIWCANIKGYDLREEPKIRPYAIISARDVSPNAGTPEFRLVAMSCTDGPRPALAGTNYIALQGRTTKEKDHGYLDIGLCVTLPNDERYLLEKPKILGKLKPESLVKLQQIVRERFFFPIASGFDEPIYAEFRNNVKPGFLTYFNYTALNNNTMHARGPMGPAVVLGYGEEVGLYPNSVICAPVSRSLKASDAPDISPLVKSYFHHPAKSGRDAYKNFHPVLSAAFAVPHTNLYFPNGAQSVARLQENDAVKIRKMLEHHTINTIDLDIYLDKFGLRSSGHRIKPKRGRDADPR